MFLLRASTWILLMFDVRGSGPTAEQAFSAIYKRDRWGGTSDEKAGGGSGGGSSELGAIGASRVIFHLAMKYALSGIVDAPCGAMAWQESLVHQLQHTIPGFQYLGLDIVQSVVQRNRARFLSWPNVTFVKADLTRPESVQVKGAYGLLFSRDSMMHNTLEGCWQMLDTFTRSPVKYVLLGSYGADKPGRRNGAVQNGKWFSIQLERPPFGMQYIEKIPEANSVGENKLCSCSTVPLDFNLLTYACCYHESFAAHRWACAEFHRRRFAPGAAAAYFVVDEQSAEVRR